MIDKLTSLNSMTKIVADTGNIEDIKKYNTQDTTTNPSLILKAIKLPKYQKLISEAIIWSRKKSLNKIKQVKYAADKLLVNIGTEILKYIPGKISTEIDARLSYDTFASIEKAKYMISLYQNNGVKKTSVLIKLASTWQGIKAAEYLESIGIHCNLTLLFSFAQAQACADAGVFLISPFVGRILDWYKNKKKHDFSDCKDPGVHSVSRIYEHYKKYNYKTLIMGASFRNINQILQLAGCDMLTISPDLLKELKNMKGHVTRRLFFDKKNIIYVKPKKITESEFFWNHNKDKMSLNKLSEGIFNFVKDQEKLEKIIYDLL